MNERFEELLYKSGLTAQGCWDEMDEYAQQAIERFAELVRVDERIYGRHSKKCKWFGLTDDELKEIQYSTDTQVEYVTYDEGEYGIEIDIFPENFAHAIEAKLKEKNRNVG